MGQSTVAVILFLTGLGGPRITHSKIWTPPLRFLKNLGKTFWGWAAQGAWPQKPLEKVKILKFWALEAFLGHCSPKTLTPDGIFFQILILRRKL